LERGRSSLSPRAVNAAARNANFETEELMYRLKNWIVIGAIVAGAALGVLGLNPGDARAAIVNVEINGSVEWNSIAGPPLNGAHVGDKAKLTFTVDSNNFLNNPVYPTRGYPIDVSSFKLSFPTFDIGLQNPYPAGQSPYFVIRNNDPAVDGFFVSTGTGFFEGVPLNQVGGFGNFGNEFHATYGGSLLSSLDVLGAQGYYDFTGLTVFNWTLQDGPFDALGILFKDMTISVPEPSVACLGAAGGLLMIARRNRRGAR
jgi:hypothetical protein